MHATRRLSLLPHAAVLLAALATTAVPAALPGAAANPQPAVFTGPPDPFGDTLAALQPEIDQASVECMAKVVMHEAGHEPHDGKVAVAQTLMNRLATGRMGASICAVANQPGQFFRTAAYNPDQAGSGWADAVTVARDVLTGAADDVAQGAMFFRSAAAPASSFFRSRQRIATVGAQIFYR